MTHLERRTFHRVQGDTPTLIVPVEGDIEAASVTAAQFVLGEVTRTLSDLTLSDEDGVLHVRTTLTVEETGAMPADRTVKGQLRLEAGPTAQTVVDMVASFARRVT